MKPGLIGLTIIGLVAAVQIAHGKEQADHEPSPDLQQGLPMKSWNSVTVSVANLDEALELWAGQFGFEVTARKKGHDADLAANWGLEAHEIHRQALLSTGGLQQGMIHFVEFDKPGTAIREQAQAFDLCPKNLDIYVTDMPARMAELRVAGWKFRNENYSQVVAPDGTEFREIHLPAHDNINIVLLEILGKELPFTEKGYAGVGPLITIVADAGSERDFFRQVMGLEMLNDNILEGPEIEQMIGLPAGSALDVSIWGAAASPLGQMEIIDYRGVEGNDLYPLTMAKHRGILSLSYEVSSLQDFTNRLQEHGIEWSESGKKQLLGAKGQMIRVVTPAGLKIDIFEP